MCKPFFWIILYILEIKVNNFTMDGLRPAYSYKDEKPTQPLRFLTAYISETERYKKTCKKYKMHTILKYDSLIFRSDQESNSNGQLFCHFCRTFVLP